jgi:phenylpropionate dioxygenase-like ring-hydroxylating dioxygenase large terminal subunit
MRATGGWSGCRTATNIRGSRPKLGLLPVALEEWRGFLFVTLEPGRAVGRRDDGAL